MWHCFLWISSMHTDLRCRDLWHGMESPSSHENRYVTICSHVSWILHRCWYKWFIL